MQKRGFIQNKILLGICVLLCGETSTAQKSRIIFENLPDSTEIFIDGSSKTPDSGGAIPVSAGRVLLEIKRNRVVVYSTHLIIDSSESKTIPIECVKGCALLHVITEPSGAILSMNGNVLGTTPYFNGFLNPGSYSIMVTYPGYIPVIRRVDLSAETSRVFSYQMAMTMAMKDSIASAKRALRLKRRIIQSTLCGTAGVAAAAAAAWFDWKAVGFLDKARENYKAYTNATSNDDCQRAKNDYIENRNSAKKPILYRNILYGTAGICLIGFYLSFAF